MSDRPDPTSDQPDPEPDWKRRQRLAEVFGDVLPDTTGDERDPGRSAGRDDQWLRDQVPPHHGG
ncbi:MAG TPA: hypothetical protein VF728_08645 [Nocardioides sp.]